MPMINKVLCDRPQSFSDVEKAQGRANIGAMAASASSSYLPYSAISADANSAITSINGSSVGSFSGVSSNNNVTGNGSTSSPIGLSSRIEFPSATSGAAVGHRGMTVSSNNHTAWYYGAFASFEAATASANYRASEAEFSNASGTSVVNKSSIDRWNSYSAGLWNESGNSLSTGYGGYQVSAAWQYNETGNWAARTVAISGSPDQTMYGFQSKPNGTATYGVNAAGAFVRIPQQNYFTYLFHVTGAMVHQFDIELFPTGLTADARLDFVNLCSAASANIKTDTFHGTTSNINPGESATMWYIATANIWTDGSNQVPV